MIGQDCTGLHVCRVVQIAFMGEVTHVTSNLDPQPSRTGRLRVTGLSLGQVDPRLQSLTDLVRVMMRLLLE